MDQVKKKRIVTKLGDIFCVELDHTHKCYFQYIANDMSMLNSSVIRVFKTHYSIDANPSIDEIINDEIDFYAHTVLRFGITDNIWYKIGKSRDLDFINYSDIIFCTFEFFVGTWSVWRMNGNTTRCNMLPQELLDKVEIEGAVLPYSSIVDRIKYGYYRESFDAYNFIKRIPRKGLNSYLRKESIDEIRFFHFKDENLINSFILIKGDNFKIKGNDIPGDLKFWDINWKHWNFISEQEFYSVMKQYVGPNT